MKGLPLAHLARSPKLAGRTLSALIAVLALCHQAAALTIIPTFDSTITGDTRAADIEATIKSCIAEYGGGLSDNNTTVNITFAEMTTGLGQSQTYTFDVSYISYRSVLVARSNSVYDAVALANSIPNTAANPVNGNANVTLSLPLARVLGLTSFTESADSTISLNTSLCNINPETDTDPSKYSLFAVACHEIDEALGIGGRGTTLTGTNGTPAPTGSIGPLDLFRYASSGGSATTTRSFTTAASATSILDYGGGATAYQLAPFNQAYPGDYGDNASTTPIVQNAIGTPGAQISLGTNEWIPLDIVGYNWRGSYNIWVDGGYTNGTSSGSGTVYNPYGAISQATATLSPGGAILLKAGNVPLGKNVTTGVITNRCRIQAANGTATIY